MLTLLLLSPALFVLISGLVPLLIPNSLWEWWLITGLGLGLVVSLRKPRRPLSRTAYHFLLLSCAFLLVLALNQWLAPDAVACGWRTIALGLAGLATTYLVATSPGGTSWRLFHVAVAASAALIVICLGSLFHGYLGQRQQFVWPSLNVNLVVNLPGPIILAGALHLLDQRIREAAPRWQTSVVIAGTLCLLAVSVLTGRRAFWWALAIAPLLAVALSQRPAMRYRIACGAVGLLVTVWGVATAAGVLPGMNESDQLRPLAYRAACSVFLANPLLGIGPLAGFRMHGIDLPACQNLTASATHVTHCHSSLIEGLASAGVLGTGIALIQCALLVAAWRKLPASWANHGIALAGLMLLLVTTIDATGAHLVGHLIVGVTCGVLLGSQPSDTYPSRLESAITGTGRLVGSAACVWLSSCLTPLCYTFITSPPSVLLASLKKTYDPEAIICLTNHAYQQALATGQRWQALETLAISRAQAGLFGIQITYWVEQALVDAPYPDRAALLVESIRRMPFQDSPYVQLAQLYRNAPWIDVHPNLLRRAAWIADPNAIPDSVWSRTLDSNGAAIDLWAAATSSAARRTIPETAAPQLYELIHRWRQSPGVALAAIWICAHQPLLDPERIAVETPGLFWTLRMQPKIHLAFDAIRDPVACRRILPLVNAIAAGGNLPLATYQALDGIRTRSTAD